MGRDLEQGCDGGGRIENSDRAADGESVADIRSPGNPGNGQALLVGLFVMMAVAAVVAVKDDVGLFAKTDAMEGMQKYPDRRIRRMQGFQIVLRHPAVFMASLVHTFQVDKTKIRTVALQTIGSRMGHIQITIKAMVGVQIECIFKGTRRGDIAQVLPAIDQPR